ncbi:MAG TPA: hypothetical protein VFQ76_08345 [Longimicrobiaceae bacterium]|nr:hypothetical protein [Longimicrobiaceae bacterium]
MSILSYFRDPTRDWPAGGPVPVVYDLARRELNGIPVGAPADRLRPLGRPGNRKPSWIGIFGFPRLGIQVHLLQGRVRSVSCVFRSRKLGDTEIEDHPEFRPCEIELLRGSGERVRITAGTTQEEVERRLGPLTRDRSEPAYPVLGITVDGVPLTFELDSDGRLHILDIEPE